MMELTALLGDLLTNYNDNVFSNYYKIIKYLFWAP